jgi:HTH-type transcriptional regulator/antitoxin HigA
MQSARLIPPGKILRRELDERGMTQKELAKRMGRPEQAISEIVNAKKQITSETALGLEQVLGVSAMFWLNIETAYRLGLVEEYYRERDAKDSH